jgi:hypothetical protein
MKKIILLLILGIIFLIVAISIIIFVDDVFKLEINEKTEFELKKQFGCDVNLNKVAILDDHLVMKCVSTNNEIDSEAVYQMRISQTEIGNVNYLIYDGKNCEKVTKSNDLKKFFLPIEASEVLIYTYLYEGLDWYFLGNDNYSLEKLADRYILIFLYTRPDACQCDKNVWKGIYEVTKSGKITEKDSYIVSNYSKPNCTC